MSATHDTQQTLFTCISCAIGYPTAEDQREHYRSDHHRYNMKRRVAALPPVSAAIFNEKVIQRRADTAVTTSPKGAACQLCSKTYTTENAYRSHMNSKKHKENEIRAAAAPKRNGIVPPAADGPAPAEPSVPAPADRPAPPAPKAPRPGPSSLTVDADADEDEIAATIDAKIAAARARLGPTACLFCPARAPALAASLAHMAAAHSFFVPDAEFLRDLPGLVAYLGDKVAVGNVCLFCGATFRTLDAVWRHMADKAHCKIAYDAEADRLEVSDFYDFSASYPDAVRRGKRAAKAKARAAEAAAEAAAEEWEDMEDDGDGEWDEVVEEDAASSDAASDASDDLPDSQITYGDTPFELVLPSGARIGHRTLRRYYAQSFPPAAAPAPAPSSGAALVRRLLADKRTDLVPARGGGFGAFGGGTLALKARNRGEAREAGRHVREFRDQRRKEAYKTRVAFVHNHQKHFRDPLLQ